MGVDYAHAEARKSAVCGRRGWMLWEGPYDDGWSLRESAARGRRGWSLGGGAVR